MSIAGVSIRPDPYTLASQLGTVVAAPAQAAATTAAHQGAGAAAAVQAAQFQGVGGIAFDPTSPAATDDARSRVASALAVAAGTQQTAPAATGGGDAASITASASNSVVAGVVQTANAAFLAYAANGQQSDYGSSVPRGNTVNAVA